MSQAVEQSWAEWAQEHYTAVGDLRTARNYLRKWLERRFGPLPEAVHLRIEATNGLNRLEAVFLQAMDIKSLNELPL